MLLKVSDNKCRDDSTMPLVNPPDESICMQVKVGAQNSISYHSLIFWEKENVLLVGTLSCHLRYPPSFHNLKFCRCTISISAAALDQGVAW